MSKLTPVPKPMTPYAHAIRVGNVGIATPLTRKARASYASATRGTLVRQAKHTCPYAHKSYGSPHIRIVIWFGHKYGKPCVRVAYSMWQVAYLLGYAWADPYNFTRLIR